MVTMTVPGIFSSVAHSITGTNGATQVEEPRPLKITVCGAGIGGLAAAIGLRRQGHEVTLLEQWDGASEAGAAVHIAPNCNGILRRLGVIPETFKANEMTAHTDYGTDGKLIRTMSLIEPNKMWQHPWQLAHRVHLHKKLMEVATQKEGKGIPAVLRFSCRVVNHDTESATVTLTTGEKVVGDLIIGADGVSSLARKNVKGGHVVPFSSGKSAFRFLVARSEAQNDERTKKFAQKEGELIMCVADDRKIVMYPCHDNELLNFVCIHPDTETAAPTPVEDWNAGGSLKKLLEVYKEFDDDLKALLSKAQPSSLKVWKLLDMEKLPTWINGKLALLGDAAHPFLPHQGQGAGVAIEDGASLAVVLPFGTKPSEIPDRLELYESCRYERAHRIQEYTRQAGKDKNEPGHVDMMEYMFYNLGHDEWDASTKKFEEWTWKRNPNVYWRMPIAFGPMPGPRQAPYTAAQVPALHSTFTTAAIKFKTSRTFLQNLFPTKQFSFKSPGTVCYASFSQTTLGNMEWLGGSGYKHIGLYIHGVQYTKKDGSTIEGTYMPLLFESLADPITSGRDELGMPKIYCSVDVRRREKSYTARMGWEGSMFGSMDLEELEESSTSSEGGAFGGENDYGLFIYKYIPATGKSARGQADVEYPVIVPHGENAEVVPSTVHKVYKSNKASFKFDSLTQGDLPTLHHIVSKLEQIPVYEIVSAKVVEGTGVPDVSAARRIE